MPTCRFPSPLQRDTVLAAFNDCVARMAPDDPQRRVGEAMMRLITHMHEDDWQEWAPRLGADLNAFLAVPVHQ